MCFATAVNRRLIAAVHDVLYDASFVHICNNITLYYYNRANTISNDFFPHIYTHAHIISPTFSSYQKMSRDDDDRFQRAAQ